MITKAILDLESNAELPQMMVHMLILRLAPLLAGEAAKEGVDVAVEAGGAEAVKFFDQRF